MKKYVLLIGMILFGLAAPVLAQEGEIHGKVGYTYDTLYVFRGFLTYGHHSASHPFIDLDLCGTGFGFEAVGHFANSSGHNGPQVHPDVLGYDNGKRIDYSLYYRGAIDPEEAHATLYQIGYRYFNYPSNSATGEDSIDLQEVYAGVAFPKLLGCPGLVPGYVIVKGWPSESDTIVGGRNPSPENPGTGTYSGWAHIFMLDYALGLEGISSEVPKQNLNFHAEVVYNDGVDPRPGGNYSDSDWTHALFGVSTDFDLGCGFIFTPAYWHQITFEDDPIEGVSPDHDIDWVSLTIKYQF